MRVLWCQIGFIRPAGTCVWNDAGFTLRKLGAVRVLYSQTDTTKAGSCAALWCKLSELQNLAAVCVL